MIEKWKWENAGGECCRCFWEKLMKYGSCCTACFSPLPPGAPRERGRSFPVPGRRTLAHAIFRRVSPVDTVVKRGCQDNFSTLNTLKLLWINISSKFDCNFRHYKRLPYLHLYCSGMSGTLRPCLSGPERHLSRDDVQGLRVPNPVIKSVFFFYPNRQKIVWATRKQDLSPFLIYNAI